MKHLIIFTDPGKDQDDEVMLILLAALIKGKYIENATIVASLAPSLTRARLAKGTLLKLGVDLPVISGSEIIDLGIIDVQLENIPYLAPDSKINFDSEFLIESLVNANQNSVVILVVAGMTDLAKLLSANQLLIKDKVSRVVFMSGVKTNGDGSPVKDENNFFVPDSSANNEFDIESAQYCFETIQKLKIPFMILSRYAAYSCKVQIELFNRMAATNHVLGIQLLKSLKHRLESLWIQANTSVNNEQRQGLPSRCDRDWFIETFCEKGSSAIGIETFEEIWKCIKWINLYDPIALIASVDQFAQEYFEPNEVIGLNKKQTGVKNPEKLKKLIETLVLAQLSESS